MNFTVRWVKQALDALTDGWLQADSIQREAITSASANIDRRLATDPLGEGESRSGRNRWLFVNPLAVAFRLEEDEKTVSVLHVRVVRRRK